MAGYSTGKKILDGLVEYPLPSRPGTKDYVYFFIPTAKDYGKSAKIFFKRHFKDHIMKDVGSLEALVHHLDRQIRNDGVTHIREVVIVCHAVPVALLLDVVDGVTATERTGYQNLTAGSLVVLQADFKSGKFPDFKAKRERVIQRLTSESWITIRACNFGQSRAGMYALYSFFGGRANVYAPTVYQFFGWQKKEKRTGFVKATPTERSTRSLNRNDPISGRGTFITSRLDLHEHFVKQRFFPRDLHTPNRQDAIARSFADPARFTEPAELIARPIEFNAPGENAAQPEVEAFESRMKEVEAYESLLEDLDHQTITAALRALLAAQHITLSGKPTFSILERGAVWRIQDEIRHGQEQRPFTVEYHLFEQREPHERLVLMVDARILDFHTTKETFAIQAFFDRQDQDEYRGKEFVLEGYTEPEASASFDALLALLTAGGPGAEAALAERFREHDPEFGDAATLSVLSPPTGDPPRATWLVTGSKQEHEIRLENPVLAEGNRAHSLNVYRRLDKNARKVHEFEVAQFTGADPDTPGTELMAYLDRHSIDDLAAFIDHLRAPYKTEHVVYLHHAMQAIARKREFPVWEMTKLIVDVSDPLSDLSPPYIELSLREREDKQDLAYNFMPNSFWAEVKVSNPPSAPFQTDLFTEQTFSFTATDLDIHGPLEEDSPFTDVETIRAIESQGLDPFFAAEKPDQDLTTDDPDTVSCAEFRDLIVQLKAVEGKSVEEIDEAIRNLTLHGHLPVWVQVPKAVMTFFSFQNAFAGSGGIPEAVVSWLLPALPEVAVPRIAVLLTRALPIASVIAIPAIMWLNFTKEQSNTLEKWEQTGKLTAVRQWARKLRSLTFDRKNDFPTTLEIDIGDDVVASYRAELETQGQPFQFLVFGVSRMAEGFVDGRKLIEAQANSYLSRAGEFIDDALRKGGLDNCMIGEMRSAGLLDPARSRALVMRRFAETVLDSTPNP